MRFKKLRNMYELIENETYLPRTDHDKTAVPCVSVVMAVLNGARFLRDAIESVLGQTFTDFEFIIIDDGSTDDTWRILTEYAAQDSRIVLIRNEKNQGIASSVNRGLARARGKYIARMDADDVTIPERFAKEVRFLEDHPEVGMVGSNMFYIDSSGNIHPSHWRRPQMHNLIKWRLCFEDPIANVTVMMRRNIVIQLNGYQAEYESFAEDYDLWQRMCQVTRMANLSDIFTYARRCETYTSNVSSRYSDRQYQNCITIAQRMISTILGEAVPKKHVRNLHARFGKTQWKNNGDLRQAAWLIYRLCRSFLKDKTLSAEEKRLIRQDAALQMYRLFRFYIQDIRVWPILIGVWQLDPTAIGFGFRRKVRQMLRIQCF